MEPISELQTRETGVLAQLVPAAIRPVSSFDARFDLPPDRYVRPAYEQYIALPVAPLDAFVLQFDQPQPALNADSLRQAVRTYLEGKPWTFIGGYRLERREAIGGDAVPMVTVAFRPGTRTKLEAEHDVCKITSILARINLADTIGVQIVEAAPTPSTLVDNAGDWGTQDWSLRETYTVHPAVGTSIGVTGSSTVGTLGLSARIAWKETQQPDKFVALTCSHVLQRDCEPLRLHANNTSDEIRTVVCPADDDHQAAMQAFAQQETRFEAYWQLESILDREGCLSEREVAAYSAAKAERSQNCDNREVYSTFDRTLGNVLCTSGLGRLRGKAVMDWGLVELSPRRFQHLQDSSHAGLKDQGYHHKTHFTASGLPDKLRDFMMNNSQRIFPGSKPASLRKGDGVMKVGRTTGLTFGTVHAIPSTIRMCYYYDKSSEGQAPRVACEIEGEVATLMLDEEVRNHTGGLFGAGGDSGATVWDRAGRPVGMYFGGNNDGSQKRAHMAQIHYVSSLEDVIRDVEDMLMTAEGDRPVIAFV